MINEMQLKKGGNSNAKKCKVIVKNLEHAPKLSSNQYHDQSFNEPDISKLYHAMPTIRKCYAWTNKIVLPTTCIVQSSTFSFLITI